MRSRVQRSAILPNAGSRIARHSIDALRGPILQSAIAFLSLMGAGACSDTVSPTAVRATTLAAPHLTITSVIEPELSLGGSPTFGSTMMSDVGHVVGSSQTPGDVAIHAFRWTPGVGTQDLGTLGGANSRAYGVSADGQAVVGESALSGTTDVHAFLWTPGGGMRDLGTLGGGSYASARSVASAGQAAAGVSQTAQSGLRAFRWTAGGGIADLGTLGGPESYAEYISADGEVVAGISTMADGSSSPFVWTSASGMQPLSLGGNGENAGQSGEIRNMNASGQVVGWSWTAGNQEMHAFLWTPGIGIQDLGTLGGTYSVAFDLNDAGEVVGHSYKATGGGTHAFRWTSATGMQDLGGFGGWYTSAFGINAAGQIVGASRTASDESHAFIWTRENGMEDLYPTTGFIEAKAISDNLYVLRYDGLKVAKVQVIPTQPPQPGATDVGTNIAVTPLDAATGATPVTLTFGSVLAPGTTTVTSGSTGAPPPLGFKMGTPPVYYELQTTATFSGAISICFAYTPSSFNNPAKLRLFHGAAGGTWTDVTTSNDAVAGKICGSVTSLSPFIYAELRYDFAGFYQPVDNGGVYNKAKAGSAIPVRFSLGGDRGLAVFTAGYPQSQQVACPNGAQVDAIEETVSAGTSSLNFVASTNQYTFVWKSVAAWAGTCRRFMLGLNDGSIREALFQFTK